MRLINCIFALSSAVPRQQAAGSRHQALEHALALATAPSPLPHRPARKVDFKYASINSIERKREALQIKCAAAAM